MVKVKIVRGKRGILITLGLVMAALSIFALAIVMPYAYQKSYAETNQLAALDRARNIHSAVQSSAVQIFNLSGIDISMTDQTVWFSEQLPNTNASNFAEQLTLYESFIEGQEPAVELDLDEVRNNLPLHISPVAITYSHEPFGGDEIRVSPQSINFVGYDVHILDVDTGKVEWKIKPKPGSLKFHILAGSYEQTVWLDPNYSSELVIDLKPGSLKIRIEAEGMLRLITIDKTVKIKTGIQLQENLNSRIDILYPANIFRIWLPEFGVARESTIKIK